MVFINQSPDLYKMSGHRCRVFYNKNDMLLTDEGVELDSPTTAYIDMLNSKKSTKPNKFAKEKSMIFTIPIMNLPSEEINIERKRELQEKTSLGYVGLKNFFNCNICKFV